MRGLIDQFVAFKISGNVKEDTDNDNTREDNLEGVTVVLQQSKGNVVQTTLTDSAGNYEFVGIDVGDYFVSQQNLAGYYVDVSDIKNCNPSDITIQLIDSDSLGNNFGDEQLGSISCSAQDDNGEAISFVLLTLTDSKQ